MATVQVSSVKSQTPSRSFTRALSLAFSEWLLMLMLFVNAIFSYLITKFADYSELQSPCLLCSRLDHVLGKKRSRHYRDLICSKHRSEISSLVYCHAHDKLVDVHGMCETCLFSFATINKSNAETYRLLVGKLGENSCFGLNSDSSQGSDSPSARYCTCCNQPWISRAYTQVAQPELPFKAPSLGHLRAEKQAVQARDIKRKKVGFYHLPHVGYSELKIHSDTESQAEFSDDDDDEEGAGLFKGDHHTFHTVDLEPRVITLPYDLATDKLIDHVSASEPLVSVATVETGMIGHGVEELKFQGIGLSSNSASVPQFVSLDDLSEKSGDVLPEKELISFSDTPFTSQAEGRPAKFVRERDLIFPHYISLTDFMEHPLDVSSQLDIHETPRRRLMETEFFSFNDIPSTLDAEECSGGILEGIELIVPFSDVLAMSGAHENDNGVISVDEVHQSFTTNEISLEASKESVAKAADDTCGASEGIKEIFLEVLKERDAEAANDIHAASKGISSTESVEPVAEVPTITHTAENNELQHVRDESSETQSAPETKSSQIPSVSEMPPQVVPYVTEADTESKTSSLDLTDAYKIAIGNGDKEQSSVVQTEQCTGKDPSRISEDLKALLTQISASIGIELLSPRDVSPKISVNSEDMKSLDDMQFLLQRRLLERNESNLSLEGVAVGEIEGESEMDRLKRQVDHDRVLLTGLYKELEEERNASTVAANQAMAMITRLQEDKASFQMEALQNLRMMEEQAEYDMEAIQKLNDSLADREKAIQDLEAELEFYRSQSPSASPAVEQHETSEREGASEKACEADSPHERVSNMVHNPLLGLEDERLYITNVLEKIEKKLHLFSNHETHTDISNGECTVEDVEEVNGPKDNVSSHERSKDMASVEEEVSELHERLERLKGDLYFLEHVINSLGHGNEGVKFVKEIASHLQMLRSLSTRRRDETVS